MNLFVDESGSITASKLNKNRFFIIAFLETDKPYNVIRQFRKAKADYIKVSGVDLDITKEIKGSEMPYGMKKAIFKRINEKTDVTFHFKAIDNFNLVESLIHKTALSFNYFVYLTVNEISKVSNSSDLKMLKMQIDDRNTAIESLNSLQEYLMIKFTIEDGKFETIKTSYKNSESKDLIQVVDLFANTVFRVCKNHALGSINIDKKNRELIKMCNVGCAHYFPWNSCSLDICKKR
ncbi:hypothetical protein WQ3_02509 [Enterococcus faecalis EnGen0338]|uniref:DUF3800 domain-containing protein n=1 Tax=Enterococcus faecalis TaxID=1351 RepID=UPI00032E7F6A|nr:DUF3800 domain-containing protein [Enterococcus faecalis]EOK20173.1 hypothetical protein WQ3_02509 [Enterococcus faecalis EnGen0338]